MRNRFFILTVCTGNVCRSPMAQYLLKERLRSAPEIEVSSAGVRAQVGRPMFETSRQFARLYGAQDPSPHEARQVVRSELEASDLILALSSEHRRSIVELSPRVTRRTFTLREFARLAEVTTDEDLTAELAEAGDSPTDRLRAAVQAASLSRSIVPALTDPAEHDVVDPYMRSDGVHRTSTEQIVSAVDTVASLLLRAVKGQSS